MDYKKKYKEAIERAKYCLTTDMDNSGHWAVKHIFPELKESEDERIRKGLIEYFKYCESSGSETANTIDISDIISWLEKQGENVYDDELTKLLHEVTCHFINNTNIPYSKREEVSKKIIPYVEKLEKQSGQSQYWKPSKDEMDALYGLAYITGKMDDKKDEAITKLYQDLKREFFNGASFENMFPSNPVDSDINVEKQREQKPTDKVEPKFNVGDWVVIAGRTGQIIFIQEKYIIFHDTDGKNALSDCPYRLWTIQDAKDGDVLVASDCSIFIFKEIVDCGCKHYIALEKDNETINVNYNLKHFWESVSGVKPATKEQRDLLFQKMKEAGYEWDSDKKELKKIEQNPTWSEEDERISNAILESIDFLCLEHFGVSEDGLCNWLKSLRPKKQWKPSEYEISLLEEIARNIRNNVRPFCSEVSSLECLIEKLKNL